MRPMTDRQKAALDFIRGLPNGKTSGYHLKRCGFGTLATLQQLHARGMVAKISAPGNMAFPQNAEYRITATGIAAASQ